MFPFESLIDVSISDVRKVVSIGWVGRHERTRFAFFSHSSAECFLYLSNFASKQCEQIRKLIPIGSLYSSLQRLFLPKYSGTFEAIFHYSSDNCFHEFGSTF